MTLKPDKIVQILMIVIAALKAFKIGSILAPEPLQN
jgi:hypothetical protein